MSTSPSGSLEEFISNDQYNLEQISHNLPYFLELMPRIDSLYECSLNLLPIANSDVSAALNQFLLLCHKGFRSAAVTIGRRHPDDAAAITRRAIEAARLAIAIKHDAGNLERWKDYEVRLARWADRRAGKLPKQLRIKLLYPAGHAALDSLWRSEHALSDGFVHFTPEFLERQAWRHETRGDDHFLGMPYQEPNQRNIERELIFLGGVHRIIIDVFDECLERSFSRQDEWRARRADVEQWGQALRATFYGPSPDSSTEEKGGD